MIKFGVDGGGSNLTAEYTKYTEIVIVIMFMSNFKVGLFIGN
jgi:hypothetical protein